MGPEQRTDARRAAGSSWTCETSSNLRSSASNSAATSCATTPTLDVAFKLMNESFARAKGRQATWRLFQLVFIISELGALAGRETRPNPVLRTELNAVDVLWYPTGGGKTEAYLGLIVVALFFDRRRGKLRGTTAWLLFPLRMLSVQQLARISEIVHHAETVRSDENMAGDPFALGYLVGAGNTPEPTRRAGLQQLVARPPGLRWPQPTGAG